MNTYTKLSYLGLSFLLTSLHAQEIKVPSLRSLALDKTAEVLHSDLIKPQSPAQRKIILDYWQDKAGILFNKPARTSDIYKPTIIERFEQKYATQLNKIAELKNGSGIIDFTLDGDKYGVDNYDKSFAIVESANGKILQEFIGQTINTNHVAWAIDNTKPIVTSADSTLEVWDLNALKCLQTLNGDTGSVRYFVLTADSTKAVSASWDPTLKVWDLNTGKCLHTLDEHTQWVNHFALTTDNTKAISASNDNTLKVWDLNTGECLQTLDEHTQWVNHVALTTDNTKAISASDDRKLKVWDLNTGKCLQTLMGHTGWIKRVTLTTDNTKAISASNDNTLKVWDLNTGGCLQTITTDSFDIIAQNNFFAVGKTMYQFEDYQSIINAMPQPKPFNSLAALRRMINGATAGAITGIIKLQALMNKNRYGGT